MRSQSKIISAAVVGALGLVLPNVTWADTTSVFSNFAPNVSANSGASFEDPPLDTSGALAFDPNNASTLYINNRSAPTHTPDAGGVYPWNPSTQTRISNTSGPILLSSNVMTWTAGGDPKANVVGNDGSLYVAFSNSAAIYKITNPLSDSPIGTKILSNYNNTSADDDPASMARLPASFGLAGYSSNDLVLFDSGLDANNINAVVAVHSDGSDATSPHVIWQRPTAAASGMYGAVDPNSGYAYWINTIPEHNTVNGSDHVSLYRVKGDGVLQTIGLNLPSGITLGQADEALAINPVDGSIWFTQVDPDDATAGTTNNRTMVRVDTSNLTATSDPNAFLADVTSEFVANQFNLGLNGLTFTPDGTKLYASTPSGSPTGTPPNADKIYVFDITPGSVPEPASLSLLAMGGMALLRRRRSIA